MGNRMQSFKYRKFDVEPIRILGFGVKQTEDTVCYVRKQIEFPLPFLGVSKIIVGETLA